MSTMAQSKTSGKWGSIQKEIRNRWQVYLMMLPAVILLLLFSYKPMYGVVIAFKNYNFRGGIWGSPWVGLKQFEILFSSYWFPIILKNTLSISLIALVLGFPFPIILALMTNEIQRSWVKKTVQTISYAPHFISTVVLCGMVILFLSPENGIINLAIEAFGGEAIYFMAQPRMFKWIYVISGIWQGTGWSAIIYVAALSGVDRELLEAAEIDGATRFQKVIYINFPVLVPTIIILFILRCGNILDIGYEKVFALQNSANLNGAEVISTYVYKMGLVKSNFSFSTAAGLFNSLVNSAILLLANFISKKASQISLW
ncbi:MAG: ABC transporter permease subunit [Clostridiales bacterium]|nr:ABC transporter permease subunit [Clostridiales bacterium]